jgi:rhamnose utilization protein RhaD (predicted bifunctional aldolase and dehydrogenase)
MSELELLAEVSRKLGGKIDYIQGGGGNTSLKNTDGLMYVKASGCTLKDVSVAKGFVAVNYALLRNELKSCETESDYNELLAHSIVDGDNEVRPSIETGMHACLGNCVLHTHSVWSNLITCSENGRNIAAALFPSSIWLDYATPGVTLARSVTQLLSGQESRTVFFLQSHGLVVSADSVNEAYDLHEEVNHSIKKFFNLIDADFDAFKMPKNNVEVTKILFPDQAVYLKSEELKNTSAAMQTQLAYLFILKTLTRVGLSPRFLSDREVEELIDLDAEKYRRKVALK